MVVDLSKSKAANKPLVVDASTDDEDLEILFLKLKVLELRFEEILMKELLRKVRGIPFTS